MIDEFRSSFSGELSKPSKFSVTVNLPGNLGSIVNAKTLSLRCESAVLPGRTVATSDLRIYGPTEKYPYQSSYEDVVLTFMCDESLVEKTVFNTWMDLINPVDNWNFEFKKNYASDIIVNQYDNYGNKIHEVTLYDAFPIAVNQLDLDWSSDAPYHKLSVVFAYTYWDFVPSPAGYASTLVRNNPFNLTAAIQIGALAINAQQALKNGNPYAVASVIGAASSIIPSLGGTKTLSSVLNAQGRGAKDITADRMASDFNATKLP